MVFRSHLLVVLLSKVLPYMFLRKFLDRITQFGALKDIGLIVVKSIPDSPNWVSSGFLVPFKKRIRTSGTGTKHPLITRSDILGALIVPVHEPRDWRLNHGFHHTPVCRERERRQRASSFLSRTPLWTAYERVSIHKGSHSRVFFYLYRLQLSIKGPDRCARGCTEHAVVGSSFAARHPIRSHQWSTPNGRLPRGCSISECCSETL